MKKATILIFIICVSVVKVFPQNPDVGDSIIQNNSTTRRGYVDTDPTKIAQMSDAEKTVLINTLHMIMPGDIFVKDSRSDSDATMEDHIAIVAKVPNDIFSITDPLEYLNHIALIECEFTQKIQSVIKILSLGNYNNDFLAEGTSVYKNYTIPAILPAKKGMSLNCKSWAIRRIECKTN